jgi:hypothetical protein
MMRISDPSKCDRHYRFSAVPLIGMTLGVMFCASVAIAAEPAEDFFQAKILPLLEQHCYGCHSRQAKPLEGGLRLDRRNGWFDGGDSGPAVVAGKPEQSLLWQALRAEGDRRMPPDAPLNADAIEDFRRWIAEGAVDPRRDLPAEAEAEPDDLQARQHWAFQPLRPVAIPAIPEANWSNNPIDHFILAALEQQGMERAKPASPASWLRRVTFDLTGLPPTPEEVEAFLADPSEAAYLAVVDRLLSSPHYGERQAQHWLDVVRYAETEGFEYDRLMPGMWRYRDYVIAAFNTDKPYDCFLREQLAGDELDSRDPQLRIAAGFHRLGAVRRNAGNQKVASSRNEVLTERTDIVGSAILGLTVGCARCHDHKFDPISQRDYYRLQAYFAASQEDNISLLEDAEQSRLAGVTAKLEKEISELKEVVATLEGEAESKVRQQIEALEAQLPPPGPTICSVRNAWDDFESVRVLRRGDPDLPGDSIGMRPLSILTPAEIQELPPATRQPRSALASHLLAPEHPLTARVMVNRLWLQHFGQGLVKTANDFGRNGSAPSHPELLDYLALAFVESGWKVKAMHRMMVTSQTYRQASQPHSAELSLTIDPDNRWLSHFPRRRLSGEEVRDAMLMIAGVLNRQQGGESVLVPVEAELVEQLYKPSQWEVSPEKHTHTRRSIYLLAKRNLRLPFMEVFDQPSAQTSCAQREQSTHALQALELLNGRLANELAHAFAGRLQQASMNDRDFLIRYAFAACVGRAPSDREQQLAQGFLARNELSEFCLAMYNLNAFLYVD